MPIVYEPKTNRVKHPLRPASFYPLTSVLKTKYGYFEVRSKYDFQDVSYYWHKLTDHEAKVRGLL